MKNQKGFSLMELLIVIALIGVLVTIGVASYQTAQVKSRDARRKADMQVIQNAFEQYYSEHGGTYPTADGNVGTDFLPAGFPKDPKGGSGPYTYNRTYTVNGIPYWYCACAVMEGGSGNSTASCVNMASCEGAGCTHFCVRNLQ